MDTTKQTEVSVTNNPVLSVSRGQNAQWHVIAQGLDHPLASFEDAQEACAWAIAVAKAKQGKVLVEERTARTPAAQNNGANPSEAFKFSIPVTLTGSQDLRFKSSRSANRWSQSDSFLGFRR